MCVGVWVGGCGCVCMREREGVRGSVGFRGRARARVMADDSGLWCMYVFVCAFVRVSSFLVVGVGMRRCRAMCWKRKVKGEGEWYRRFCWVLSRCLVFLMLVLVVLVVLVSSWAVEW